MAITVNFDAESKARRDYQHALSQAFWRKILHWSGRNCNDLLSFREILQSLQGQPRSEPVLMEVPTAQIVGSSGRHRDFDLAYYPRRRAEDNRWVRVAAAKYRGVKLPPILLYKVGEAYFVDDGNHRVSVARVNGEGTILAKVIELDASALVPEPKCSRLGYKLSRIKREV